MSAGHGVNHVTVWMRPEHLLHAIAGAKRQIARGVKLMIAAAQDWPRRFVAVVTFHDGKPVEKESCQRYSVPLCRLASNVTQSTFGERKDYVRFEMLHRLFQSSIGCQRPHEVFVVLDPWRQSRTESALSQTMNKIWQPQLCVNHKPLSKICVAGDVQFKRASLDKVPVHDDAHTTVVSWWHNADQQNATLCCHRELPELSCF